MPRLITVCTGEGFSSVIEELENSSVRMIADADIDEDGANGQNGAPAGYMVDDRGREFLANGGMRMSHGKVVGDKSWFRDIVILGQDGQPKEFPGGLIASKTAYHFPGVPIDDPNAYVDAETVRYICVPAAIIQGVAGIVLGCRTVVTNLRNSKVSIGIVADVGPRNKNGELSPAMARDLGLRDNPRNGGEDRPFIKYEIWPGVHGEINGQKIALQRSKGGYIFPA